MLEIILNSLHIIFCLLMIIMVLLQSSKQSGLSGLVSGGTETFFGKHKGRTLDAMLSRYTPIVAICLLITSVWLQWIIGK